jgi:hypothetical protein
MAKKQNPGDQSKDQIVPAKAAYHVGYRRPPREYQFKPGKSGNPKSRSGNFLNRMNRM